jgi:surfeit locus 1 family protein
LATVIGVAATASLGLWQLSRADQKLALQASISAQKQLAALDSPALAATKNIAEQMHRPVRLTGVWLGQHTVFLDNRQMAGRPGFVVVTPLQLLPVGAGPAAVVLVQRGWVGRNFQDRAAVPAVPTPAGPVAVLGRVAPPPAKLYAFAAEEPGPIRQNLELAAFSKQVALPLLPASILQTEPPVPSDGLQRDWPQADFGVAKHHGYAFQWFGLCGLMVLLYVWFQIVQRFSARFSPASSANNSSS